MKRLIVVGLLCAAAVSGLWLLQTNKTGAAREPKLVRVERGTVHVDACKPTHFASFEFVKHVDDQGGETLYLEVESRVDGPMDLEWSLTVDDETTQGKETRPVKRYVPQLILIARQFPNSGSAKASASIAVSDNYCAASATEAHFSGGAFADSPEAAFDVTEINGQPYVVSPATKRN